MSDFLSLSKDITGAIPNMDRTEMLRLALLLQIGKLNKGWATVNIPANVSIDYLVRMGNFDWSHECFGSKDFDTEQTNSSSVKDIFLVGFERVVSSEEVFAELSKLNLRPVNLKEMLSWAIIDSNLHKVGPVAAFGTTLFDDDMRLCTPCIMSPIGSERGLGIGVLQEEWSHLWKFMATAK